MIQKLNNIIQTKIKFNHKVDSNQPEKKNDTFEKSLENVISANKNKEQKNLKIKKKNKSELNNKIKEKKQNQNIFTPFTEKNLPTILLNNYSEVNPDNDKIPNEIFFENANEINPKNEETQKFQIIPQKNFDLNQNEILFEDIPDQIEAKLQVINEFIQAIDIGFKNVGKEEIKYKTNLKNNNLANIDNKILVFRKEIAENYLISKNNDSDEEDNNNKVIEKIKNIHTEKKDVLINEPAKQTEKADAKIMFNLPTKENKKTDENIQQKVESNTENFNDTSEKSEKKVTIAKKSNPELTEKNILNDVLKEQITEFSATSKNVNQLNINNTKTYNQFGQIRLQEFTQTTLQLVRATPDNTTSMASMVLKPESLGTLFVQITMTENKAKINIMTDSSEAIKTIEQQIGALKEKLSQNGILAESIDIGFRSKEGADKFSNNNSFEKKQFNKYKEEMKEYLKSLNYLKEEENEVL